MKVKAIHKGNFNKTEKFMNRALHRDYLNVLSGYGQVGVQLLQNATPKDSGETAASWNYEIEQGNGQVSLVWTNSNTNQGSNVVLLIVYGHGMWNGGYVQGNNFVTPAIRPILDEMAKQVWKEVTK